MTNPLQPPARQPPFDALRPEHFLPALEEVLRAAEESVARLKNDAAPPSFANTVVPLEKIFQRAGDILGLLSNYVHNVYSDDIAAIEEKASLRLAEISKNIFQDAAIGARFRAVYDARDTLALDEDDRAVLTHLHHAFEAQGGLLTDPAAQKKIRDLDAELISLAQKFTVNLQAAPKQQAVLIADAAELAGLSPSEVETLAENARKAGHASGWLFIPERLLVDEWLEKAENAGFRRKMFEALNRMGTEAPHDNRPVILQMQKNRDAYAKLLGYPHYTAFARSRAMVTDLARVEKLLDDVAAAALPKFEAEVKALEAFSARQGGPATLEPWDVPYWATRQRTALYNFDANAFTRHLEINNVMDGMFDQASRLFGISFTKEDGHARLHDDIDVYAVHDAKTKDLVGYLHVDMYARPGTKAGGAWMSVLQAKEDGRPVTVICNMNITKPPKGEPTLIGLSQYITLYHELGHCLQGLLGMDVKYVSLQGTAGPADFVEIHSMINEQRALLRDNIKTFLRDADTGAAPADTVIDALLKSQSFFESRTLLLMVQNSRRDFHFHSVDPARGLGVEAVEKEVALQSPYAAHIRPYPLARFSHLFSSAHSAYAAGYVNYLLAQVHASHGFVPFRDDPYNKDWSEKLARFYRRGSGGVPADLYKGYRGEPADPTPMLQDLGILPAVQPVPARKAQPKR
jgi:peptidyl-dipeptidase Dcp